jgi:hypothetical protein
MRRGPGPSSVCPSSLAPVAALPPASPGSTAFPQPPPKNKIPARPCGRTGKMGDGRSPRALSRAGIRRLMGRQLPDAILHGKRSCRPRSRAVQRFAATGLSSEAFQLAWAGGCATGLRTRPRHVCDLRSASWPLSTRTATAFGSALAPCHGSRLLTLRLPFAHKSAVPFSTSPTLGRFSRILPRPRVLPGAKALFVPSFGVFSLADLLAETARAARPCWCAVATVCPLGNCDSHRPETSLRYLTRLGAVSPRSSPPSPYIA